MAHKFVVLTFVPMPMKLGRAFCRLCLSSCLVVACTTSPGQSDDDVNGGQGGNMGGQSGAGANIGGQGGAGASGSAGESGGGGAAGGAAGAPAGGKAGLGAEPPGNAMFGLQTRPVNTTCKDPGRPTGKPGDPFPAKLSATGCFDAADPKKPGVGLIPYGVASALWSDNADKQRWMALPEGKKIAFMANGDFDFPTGTVLLKAFALDGVMLETRFLIKHSDGQWGMYTYVWDDAGKDAKLLGEGSDSRFFGETEWVFPSRANCLTCHTEAAGRTLGPDTRQFNSLFDYPSGKRANQLSTLEHIGLFATPPGNIVTLPKLPPPQYDVGASTEQRARSYLHANCSHCHQPGGTRDVSGMDLVNLDLRFDTPLKMMNICNVVPSKNNYGIADVKILTPQDPLLSMISVRMHSKVTNVRMPQIGTGVVDPLGTQVVDDWIKSVKTCP